jgi:hypothetical protein
VRKRLAAIGIATILVTAIASANWSDTSTGIDLTHLPAFPLTKIRSGLLKDGQRVRFDKFVARAVGPTGAVGEVSLEGTAKSGRKWAVHFSWIAFDEVYRGDLDRNGTQDYLVFGSTGNILRRTPPRGAIVLLMDRQGLPVPFKAGLYDQFGPEHVVDLDHNGRAGLLVSTPDEEPWDNRSGFGCSGHWVTDLYEPVDLNWRAFAGSAAKIDFPFVLRWADGPDCDPPGPTQPWNPTIRTGQDSTASADIDAARVAEAGPFGGVKLSPASGCEAINIGAVVYDRQNRRDVELTDKSTHFEDLLNRIRTDKAKVTLRGIHRQPDGRFCSANLLWASK